MGALLFFNRFIRLALLFIAIIGAPLIAEIRYLPTVPIYRKGNLVAGYYIICNLFCFYFKKQSTYDRQTSRYYLVITFKFLPFSFNFLNFKMIFLNIYSGAWGYTPKYRKFADQLERRLPSVAQMVLIKIIIYILTCK